MEKISPDLIVLRNLFTFEMTEKWLLKKFSFFKYFEIIREATKDEEKRLLNVQNASVVFFILLTGEKL